MIFDVIEKYMENGPEATNKNFEKIKDYFTLKEIPMTFTSGFQNYSNEANTCVIRVRAGDVQLDGVATNLSVVDSGAAVTIGKFDEKYAPIENCRFIGQGSSLNRFEIMVLAGTCEVKISRYGTTTSSQIGTNAYLAINGSWKVKDEVI